MRHLTARAVSMWRCQGLAKGMGKWWEEVVRSRKAMKAISMWKCSVSGRAWRTWEMRVMERRRLYAAASRAIRHWVMRKCAKVLEKLWQEVCRTRIAKRVAVNFLRKVLCRAWRSWEASVHFSGENEEPCSCNDGTCPKCGREFEERRDDDQMEIKPVTFYEEGGFVGLEVTEVPPHQVKSIKDLVDKNFVRHDEPGYCNPHIIPGDRILQVDGMEAEHIQLTTLHNLLRGPLHSTVTLLMARSDTGERYTVVALRHGYHSFEAHVSSFESTEVNGNVARRPQDPLGILPPLYAGRPRVSELYAHERNAQVTAADLYSSRRSAASGQSPADLYSSRRSAASGRSPAKSPRLTQPWVPEVEAQNQSWEEGIIASSKPPHMRIQ